MRLHLLCLRTCALPQHPHPPLVPNQPTGRPVNHHCCPPPATQAYAVQSNFENADMTNAVVDRVNFTGANLKGVKVREGCGERRIRLACV